MFDDSDSRTDGSGTVSRRRVLAGIGIGAATLAGIPGLAAADCTCYCVRSEMDPEDGFTCYEWDCVGTNCPN